MTKRKDNHVLRWHPFLEHILPRRRHPGELERARVSRLAQEKPAFVCRERDTGQGVNVGKLGELRVVSGDGCIDAVTCPEESVPDLNSGLGECRR